MGTLHENFEFTGRLHKVAAYKMQGHDQIVVRSRGGASKSRIKKSAEFEVTRQLNNEWKAVIMASNDFRDSLSSIKPVADYNFAGDVNALVKKIQTRDLSNTKGKRSILFSLYSEIFSSFQFNRKTLFNSLVREPLDVRVDKNNSAAVVNIPALLPLINFFPDTRHAYYRLILKLSLVSDYVWNEENKEYFPRNPILYACPTIYNSWISVTQERSSETHEIKPKQPVIVPEGTLLIMAAGIQYGKPGPDGEIGPVPRAGSARVILCL